MTKITEVGIRRFVPFKRIKPKATTERFTSNARRTSIRGRLTQFGFGLGTKGTLVHISDPT